MSWSQQQALVGVHGALGVADYSKAGPAAGSQHVAKHGMLASSVEGGIFADQTVANPQQEAVSQYRKSMPSGGGDFLDRLAAAEARDGALNKYVAGDLAAGDRPEYAKQMTPQQKLEAATRRATTRDRAAQAVADNEADKQRQFQIQALQKHYGGHVRSASMTPGANTVSDAAAGQSAKNLRAVRHEQTLLHEQQARLEQAERARLQREREEQTEFQARMQNEMAHRQHMQHTAEKRRMAALAHKKREEANARAQAEEQAVTQAKREAAWRAQQERAQERQAQQMRAHQQLGTSQMQPQHQQQMQQRANSPRRAASPRPNARGASPRRSASPRAYVHDGMVAAGGAKRAQSPTTYGRNERRTSIGMHAPPGGHTSISLG